MSNFVHLHVHSHYSLLDGLTKIPDLVRVAKERGFTALALTDYGSLYGAIEFYEACHKADMKPIIGMEAYIATNGRFSKQAHVDAHTPHLILLAENYEGYKNLMALSSKGHLEGFYYHPRIDRELLREHHEGLIALSGCMAGELAGAVRADDSLARAKEIAEEYRGIFGDGNFYIELQDHPELDGQMTVNTKLVQLGSELNIPLVATRDVHYLDPDDAEAQDILVCIREGKTVDQPNRLSFQQVDRSLCSGEEIAGRFQHIPEALENTVRIAERINLDIPLHQWHFPPIPIPEGKTADQELRDQTYHGIAEKLEVTPEIKERLEYELDIINTKGYAPYFLTVADLLRYAREHAIVVTTRGSAAGSLVSYALGIVSVNPLFFRLPFERFLNPYRPSPPDVDMDFADDRRDEMLAYATAKYGVEKVAQIITFGTMMARGSVRDAGRALGFAYGFCDQVAKLIPFGSQGFAMTIERALREEPELKKLYESNPDVKRLLEVAKKIEGCARHTSIHAAGVVIAPTALTDFTPVQHETGGEKIVTQYEMYSVEAAGLLKMDFLGIRNLSILGHAVEFVEKTTGTNVDINNLPWDDKKTFDMLARGETMGVFQMGGSGMTRYLKELRPSSIFDIMAMVALFRPGPMESIPEYIRRKHHPELVTYPDPRLEKILDRSYGVITYQDDVLLTAMELAGYNWEEVDKFRKAIGKKIPAEMAKQKIKFFQGCRDHGQLPEEKIEELWQLIEPFAAYGFNKAHAASYAVVAYQTAYLKANYPVQYMTAVLTAESGDADKVAAIVHECERMNIHVLPPDVNESFRDFAMIPDKEKATARIRFGLNAIKNLGAHIADVIYRERKEHGQYASLEDFLARIHDKDLNKKSLESLIKCGAFDSFGHDRGVLLGNSDGMLAFHRALLDESVRNQDSLFGDGEHAQPLLSLAELPPATAEEKLLWEKELLGLYVSAHPFDPIARLMQDAVMPIARCAELGRGEWALVGGVIAKSERKITKKGSAMLFVTLEDKSGSVEMLVFPKTYAQTAEEWREGKAVCVMAKTPKEEGDNKLFVERVYPVTLENAEELARALQSVMRAVEPVRREAQIVLTSPLGEKREKLKELFMKNPGNHQVCFVIQENGTTRTVRTNYYVDWGKIEGEVAGVLGK
ncbi:MAG: DNA polymerase III subunit alpha [Candidatus Magasanikbacteria bacterium]|nr:DNA polymerase III subunit alpha [Candidatus Magasanikbacteria bacterium]